ncbi:MAG: nuclear transport factor 2 family protein [Allosphingosinicella sp.]
MIVALLLAASAAADVEAIRGLRARSNQAISAHRVDDIRPLFADGYTAFPGSSGRPFTAQASLDRLAAAFADPAFVTYVRTPRRIVVASSGKRAAESGTWVGRWNEKDGEMRLTGIYQATWVPKDGGWRLLNESFVTLRCTGSHLCPGVD